MASKDEVLTGDQITEQCKIVIKEGRISNHERSIVGLFSKFDSLVLERMVGTANYKNMLTNEAKDVYHFG